MLFVLRRPFERAVRPITTFDPGRRGITAGELTGFAVNDP
jgi:hypothetical protein